MITVVLGDGLVRRFEPVDSLTVSGPDGRQCAVAEAVAALRCVSQLCPLMPHEYAVSFGSPDWAWRVVDAMVSARRPGKKGWWPTKAAVDAGYEPCRACRRGKSAEC